MTNLDRPLEDLVTALERLGLPQKKASEAAKNKKMAPILEEALSAMPSGKLSTDAGYGNLIFSLANTATKNSLPYIGYIAQAIAAKRLTSADQISAAIKYVETHPNASKSVENENEFNEACGVGVVVDQAEVKLRVDELMSNRREELLERRYLMAGVLLNELRQDLRLKWAPIQQVRDLLDDALLTLLGPKDERDNPKKAKKAASKPKQASRSASAADLNKVSGSCVPGKTAELAKSLDFVFQGELAALHKPGGNPQVNPLLMEQHLRETGGQVITRFPPEPNGFLHIGHAKAININFAYAQAFQGITYLRYDDTNPEAEEDRYFESILNSVRWLGFEPYKVTYSSDHFQKLYELAVKLIEKGFAYVDHSTPEEMHAQRGGDERGPRFNSPWRDRPISESLTEFQKMKEGRYKEGEAVLRMKMDMQSGNPQFWDLVAYRILYTPHVRTGDQWCIYPTYDYTHCLCDSFENITHSMCTTEFRLSRESYYWLCDALEVYKPVQWEYGRLAITNTVLSKRKLNTLVSEKHVSGWDDPRLFTLDALRRRGFTPQAINAFVRELGVTTSMTTIQLSRLENYVRDHLNDTASRLMAVLEPLKVVLTNLPEDYCEMLTVPNKPRDDALGSRSLPFTRTIYIDRSDFRETPDANFFRLSPGKSVGLLNASHPITCVDVTRDADGLVTELLCTFDKDVPFKKPKTYIQWVAESPRHNSPVKAEVRLYSNLFLHENPMDKEQVPNGWLTDLNPNSLVVLPNAYIDVGALSGKVESKFQFLRVGYFCIDRSSNPSEKKFVFNRTVTLKEDSSKKEADTLEG